MPPPVILLPLWMGEDEGGGDGFIWPSPSSPSLHGKGGFSELFFKNIMIRQCAPADFEEIYEIVNDAAQAYKGIIPPDRWREPYMPREELRHEIREGVVFWGYEAQGQLWGVMGLQPVQDVTLIRHAYIRTAFRNRGIGGKLLSFLKTQTGRSLLVGTWADAVWAVRFYEKHGFRLVSPEEKNRLLKKYWSIPERQIQTSAVLADEKWFVVPTRETGEPAY